MVVYFVFKRLKPPFKPIELQLSTGISIKRLKRDLVFVLINGIFQNIQYGLVLKTHLYCLNGDAIVVTINPF